MHSSFKTFEEEIRPLALVDGHVDPRRARQRHRRTRPVVLRVGRTVAAVSAAACAAVVLLG